MTKAKIVLASLVVCGVSETTAAEDNSSDRVENIRFEIADPTVGPKDVLVRGVALEYWYIDSKTDSNTATKYNGFLPGVSAWIGKNKWSLNVNLRGGEIHDKQSEGFEENQNIVEGEFSIRRKFSDEIGGVYILAGAIYQKRQIEDTFHDLGGETVNYDRTYTAPMLGLGAIWNFSRRWSMRDDAKVAYGKLGVSDGDPFDEGGNYYNGTASITIAFRPTQQIALQAGVKVGAKFQSWSSDKAVDKETGWLMSVGYVY